MKSAKKMFSLNRTIKNSKFDFVGNLKYMIIAPIVIALIGIILLFTVGFNLGIDFTGGTIVTVVTTNYDIEKDDQYNEAKGMIEKVLGEKGLSASLFQKTETDAGQAISVRYQDKSGLTEDQMNKLNETVKLALFDTFGYDINSDANLIQDAQRISATASSELITNAFLAMLVAMFCILIYICIRFEFTSAMAAILALMHDLIIMASFMLMFRVQINSSFVAALITILGYSINNTIIIFDRIRENSKNERYFNAPNKVVANLSIKETMTRSIYTTITTLFTITMVAIIGVSSIREFAFPIIIGIFAGFYSSVFIAPGLWAISHVRKNKIKKTSIDSEKPIVEVVSE